MATVSRESLGTLHDKITVKLEKQDYLPGFDKSLKEYAKKANIPGFRKGMVPTGLVRKMYGQSVFTDEIVKRAGKELEDFLKNEKVSIFAQPMVLSNQDLHFDMGNPSDYNFYFEIGIKPEFEVDAVKNKATLKRYKITVSDKIMDDEVKRITKQHGTEKVMESVTGDDLVVHISYEPCDASGVVAEDAKKTTHDTEMANLPARLREMLQGKKAGDTMIIQPSEICTPEELNLFLRGSVKDEHGAENHYLVTLTAVGLLEPMQVGAELFEKVFPGQGVADEAAFRDKIKEELGHEFARIAGERLQNEIFEMLVHTTNIDLPTDFLKRYMREGGENHKSAAQVDSEYPAFEHSLRWQLISDKLMGQYGISVTRDEVIDEIMRSVLVYFGVKDIADAPWLESYRARVSKDEKTMEETYNKLIVGKLFNALEGVFNVVEEEIGEEEFFKLGDAHAAHHHHH